MTVSYIVAGVAALTLIGLVAWLWSITRKAPFGTETKDGLRIDRPPIDDSRSSIATHRKIMDNQNTRA